MSLGCHQLVSARATRSMRSWGHTYSFSEASGDAAGQAEAACCFLCLTAAAGGGGDVVAGWIRVGDGIPQAISHRRLQPCRSDGVGEGRSRFDAGDVYVTRVVERCRDDTEGGGQLMEVVNQRRGGVSSPKDDGCVAGVAGGAQGPPE